MTPEAQRIAISEWWGWKPCGTHSPITSDGDDGIMRMSPNGINAVTASLLPHYLQDLNAIHETWRKLNANQRAKFAEELAYVVLAVHNRPDNEFVFSRHSLSLFANATAAQRSEALLRTLNLWKD